MQMKGQERIPAPRRRVWDALYDPDNLRQCIPGCQSQDFTGTIAGNALKWHLKVTKPVPLTLQYDAQIEGDRLVGKVKMGIFGTAKLTGERA